MHLFKNKILFIGKLMGIFMIITIASKAQVSETTRSQLGDELKFTHPNQRSMTLEVELYNNLIIIPVQINNSDTLRFILDSGMNTSIVTSLPPEEEISMLYARNVTLRGLGTGDPLTAIHSYGNKVDIGDITGINQDFYLLVEDYFELSKKLGRQIHGVMSMNVFNNFIVEIDYDREKLTFYDPLFYKSKIRRRDAVVPIIYHDTKPYIRVYLQQENNEVVPAKVLLDTGASSAIWLDIVSIPELEKPQPLKDAYLGFGLSGELHGKIGRVDKLIIGKFELKNPVVSLPDSTSIVNAMGIDERNGSIGGEILARFDIVIDHQEERLIIRKNSNFRKKFSYNMSGIEILAPIPGLRYYEVASVRKNSPGDEAGVRAGDEIISINNTKATRLELSDIYEIFQRRDGKRIKLIIRRNGVKYTKIFRLEKYI